MKSKDKIAVASRSFSQHPELRKILLNQYEIVKFNDEGKSLKGKELIAFLKDAEKAIIALEKLDGEILNELPNLKLVSKYGVGLDNIYFKELKERNILLSWTGGVNRRAVAELALSFMMLTLRKAFYGNFAIKDNNWHQVQGYNLTGKTVGIIGLGFIGIELVELLKPFNVAIMANDLHDKSEFAQENNIRLCTKEDIFKEADVITLHIPLTSQTRNIINLESMKKMKPTAVVINTARGGLVNEADLLIALNENIIAGAALDVFAEEPSINAELLHHSHFFATPHIGGSSKEAVFLMGMAAIEGLKTGKTADPDNFFNYTID